MAILLAATPVAKEAQWDKIILAAIPVEAATPMSIMCITSTMSIISVEVAIMMGMVLGIARTGVIIKDGMEKEKMAEVIKVLGAAMDMANTQVVPKAVEVVMAVTTSLTRRLERAVEQYAG